MHKAKAIMGFYFVHDEEGGGLMPLIFKTHDKAQDRANRCFSRFESSQPIQMQARDLLRNLVEYDKIGTQRGSSREFLENRRKLVQ